MTKSSASCLSPQPATWSDVARACRRICLLRERGDFAEAERWRTGPLATLLAALRTTADSDETFEARVESIFAAETERVANAAVLAELLVSLTPGTPLRPAFGVADPTPQTPGTPPAAPPRRKGTDIADFIDEMIAQERA